MSPFVHVALWTLGIDVLPFYLFLTWYRARFSFFVQLHPSAAAGALLRLIDTTHYHHL
jgi:hypothetical protein